MLAAAPILVVEDEALIRMDLVETLLGDGFTVEESDSGSDAIAKLDAAEDLQGLICDIRLGIGPDGWAVAHHARQKYPDLPVLYVTADSVAEWTAEGVPNSLILQKPYAEAQLMTAVATLINQAVALRAREGPSHD